MTVIHFFSSVVIFLICSVYFYYGSTSQPPHTHTHAPSSNCLCARVCSQARRLASLPIPTKIERFLFGFQIDCYCSHSSVSRCVGEMPMALKKLPYGSLCDIDWPTQGMTIYNLIECHQQYSILLTPLTIKYAFFSLSLFLHFQMGNSIYCQRANF